MLPVRAGGFRVTRELVRQLLPDAENCRRDPDSDFRVTRRAGQKLTSSRIAVARVTRKGFRVTRRTRGGTGLLVHRVATAGVGAERFNIL